MRTLYRIGIAWGIGILLAAAGIAPAQIVLNEILYDTGGDDSPDLLFTEIYGTPGTSLEGYSLVGLNGNGGAEYRTVNLSGTIPPDGYFVVGNTSSVPNVDLVVGGGMGAGVDWQNAGSPTGDDCDCVELQFQGSAVDKVRYGLCANPPGCEGEGGTNAPDPYPSGGINYSIARLPDHQDTDDNAADWSVPDELTPGVSNPSNMDLRIVSPNGGEEWSILQYDTVRWVGQGFGGGITIELNRDYPNGAWEVLVDSTENDGEEAVWVTDPLSDYCRVKVSALEDTLFDISDGDFSIVCSQGYLALVRPSQPNTPVLSWNIVLDCGQTASETFRLKNFGSGSIVVFQPLEPPTTEFSRTTTCPSYFALSPGQMSTCEVTLTFDPLGDGIHRDTLLIPSDAVNQQGGYVRFPLSGEQISTPDSPQVVITIEGNDARLRWNPVTQSIGGCPITVTGYLVFYSEEYDGPYWYHGFTTDTTYVHVRAAQFASGMFYEVVAYVGPLALLAGIPPEATREEVLGLLGR